MKIENFLLKLLLVLFGTAETVDVTKMKHKLQFPAHGAAYAVLTTLLPIELHEYTLCYWIRINQMNKGSNTILSYAVPSEDNEIRTYVEAHRGALYFGFNRRNHYSARVKYDIHLGVWYHFCNTWSSWSGHWAIYINGNPIANGTGVAHGLPVRQGGMIVLGQDQDTFGGGFVVKDSLIGELLDLHLWDEILTHNLIQDVAECFPHNGNIVAWLTSPFAIYGGVTIAPTQLCETQVHTNCQGTSKPSNDQADPSNWGIPCWGTRCK